MADVHHRMEPSQQPSMYQRLSGWENEGSPDGHEDAQTSQSINSSTPPPCRRVIGKRVLEHKPLMTSLHGPFSSSGGGLSNVQQGSLACLACSPYRQRRHVVGDCFEPTGSNGPTMMLKLQQGAFLATSLAFTRR